MNRQPPVFVDTTFVVAQFNPRDQWSQSARELAEVFYSRPLVTTEGIFGEFLAHFSRYEPRERANAARFAESLKTLDRMEVVELTADLVDDGIRAYGREFQYSRLSLQDCISILVMRRRGALEALTADREFAIAGITVLMQQPLPRG